MSGFTLAKTGKRYTLQEWMGLTSEEQTNLLNKYGPGYTDEAWKIHFGNRKPKR